MGLYRSTSRLSRRRRSSTGTPAGSWRGGCPIRWTLGFYIEALRDALAHCGRPTIFNTDQGSQFTAGDFTRVLRDRGIKISMDGKGRYLDNIFVERLWRSLKSEEIYLHAYESLTEAREGIGRYFRFYNDARPHTALGYQTPAAFYESTLRGTAA